MLSYRKDIERVSRGNATRDFANERHTSFLRLQDTFRISATLKSMRGFGVQTQKFRCASHRCGIEISAFDQNISRGIRNLGVFAAHHAGNGDRPLSVRYDEHFFIKVALDAVESCDCFILLSAAND